MDRVKKLLILCFCVVLFTASLQASGTGAGTAIKAPSTDLKIVYGDGGGGANTKNASTDGIADWQSSVKAIHGLLPGLIECPSIGSFTAANHGPYTNITGNTDVVLSFAYANRSNEFVTADVAVNLIQAASRWSINYSPATKIDEDQTKVFFVTINSGTALAFERVTVDVTASISETPSLPKNVVSYNAFADAVGDMQLGGYGGVDNIFNYYVFEAQGFNLIVLNRDAEITAPPLYSGNIHDPVPGAKIKYSIVVKNQGSTKATNVDVSDKIPNNCHLYFNDTPTVEGAANIWAAEPAGFVPTSNLTTGAGTTVTFKSINISPNYQVTVNYTVTID